MAAEEQVLVIERKVLEKAGMFEGLVFDVQRYIAAIFQPGVPQFMLRSQAEGDPRYKQIIPYVIMAQGESYLSYVRGKRAGEKRLQGNRSIGIGGHINPTDHSMPLYGFYEAYLEAVAREVAEEVKVETAHRDRIAAMLNDERNEVGKVHLGIVHYWALDEAKVSRKEQMITQMGFMSRKELEEVRDTMETWSQLCLDGLDKIGRG